MRVRVRAVERERREGVGVAEVEERVMFGLAAVSVGVLPALQADHAQAFDPAVEERIGLSGHCEGNTRGGNTDISARSRLSLNTPVTPRSISKLSVASVRIFCAACVAASIVGGAPPLPPVALLVCLE